MPLLIPFVAGAAVGAYAWDRFTGAAQEAGEALDRAGSGVVKLAAVAGVAYVAWELWKRGAFK